MPDRKKETVETYLKEHGQRVEVVVMDMSPATLIRSLMNCYPYRKCGST
ncbi:hypothetical protein [Virgibacillus salarius]